MPSVTGFDHIAFPVSDLDASTAFYDHVFGARLLSEHRDGERVLIRRIGIGGAVLSLHRSGNGIALAAPHSAIGCADFCLAWDGTIEQAADLLRRAQVDIIHGPRELKNAAGEPAQSIYFRDIDGNLLEIIAAAPMANAAESTDQEDRG